MSPVGYRRRGVISAYHSAEKSSKICFITYKIIWKSPKKCVPLQSKKEESGNVANSYPDAPLYMANSVYPFQVRFMVDEEWQGWKIKDELEGNCNRFVSMRSCENYDYWTLTLECTDFGFTTYDRACRAIGKNHVAFSVYENI